MRVHRSGSVDIDAAALRGAIGFGGPRGLPLPLPATMAPRDYHHALASPALSVAHSAVESLDAYINQYGLSDAVARTPPRHFSPRQRAVGVAVGGGGGDASPVRAAMPFHGAPPTPTPTAMYPDPLERYLAPEGPVLPSLLPGASNEDLATYLSKRPAPNTLGRQSPRLMRAGGQLGGGGIGGSEYSDGDDNLGAYEEVRGVAQLCLLQGGRKGGVAVGFGRARG